METYHEKYNRFYNSSEWKKLREVKWVNANGMCEHCLRKRIVRPGKEIHHIIPIEKDWTKRLDYENLVCLCPECHRIMHDRESPLQKFNKYWEGLGNAASTASKPGKG